LGYLPLTGLIQAIKSGIPNPFPPKLFTTTRKIVGDAGRYTQVTGARTTTRLVQYGAPAKRQVLRNVASRDVKLIHTFLEQAIPPLVMQALRNYDNYEMQRMGMEEVSRQAREFTVMFMNMRIAVTALMLAYGQVGFDSDGNLLPNSGYSGATEQVSIGMNANNQNQLNGLISKTWSDPTTDIPLQLRNLKLQAAELTGYPLKYAFYGVNVPGYFSNNDAILDYLSRNDSMRNKWLETAEIPDGLFGYTWVPVYTSFWEDQNGTNQAIFGGDTVVFTPEIAAEWWEMIEGSYLVPTTINIQTDAVAAMNSLKQVFGMFGYGLTSHNPPGVMSYYGDTMMPVIKVPNAVFQSNVVF